MSDQEANHAPSFPKGKKNGTPPRLALPGSRSPSTTTPNTTATTICATLPHVHTITELPSFKPFVWHTKPAPVSATLAPNPASAHATG